MKLLHLAKPEDRDRILPLMAQMHKEMGWETDVSRLAPALEPLLDGTPHGAVWVIGPRKAPVGYVAVSFGWSLEYGGLDAIVDELYIRPAVRGRGMASEALSALSTALKGAGVVALHLEVNREDKAAARLYGRAKFEPRDGYVLMSRTL